MKWKDLSLKERKQIYDSVRVNNPGATYFDIKEQFDSIPAYEDGGKSIVDEVNKSDANFVQRLKSPTRQTIPNWEDQYRVLPWEKSVSTHKLSVWDNANGGGIIVPDVQEVNGKLIDFTRPPYNNRAAVENALKTGGDTDKDGYGQINIKNIKDNILPTDINDYSVILDNNIYMPGTANHE